MSSTSVRSPRAAFAGLGCGLGAGVVGYLAVYLAAAGTIRNSAAFGFLEAFGSDLSVWKVVGWLFLNVHGVATVVPGLFGSTSSVNLVQNTSAFSPLLYAVPVVCLLAAGVAAAVLAGAASPAEGAFAGATVAFGYFVVAAVGLFAFTASFGENVVRPDPVTTVLLAGLVAPAALGAVGGAAAAAARDGS